MRIESVSIKLSKAEERVSSHSLLGYLRMVTALNTNFEWIRRMPIAKFLDDTTHLSCSAALHYLELNAVVSQS